MWHFNSERTIIDIVYTFTRRCCNNLLMYLLHTDLVLDRAQPEDGFNCEIKRDVELFYSQYLANLRMISNIATQTSIHTARR